MKPNAVSLLARAIEGCKDGRQVLIRVDGQSFEIRQLDFQQGRDFVASALLESREKLFFDPECLSCVTVGAKV